MPLLQALCIFEVVLVLFIIEYFPPFALAFLVMSCNFDDNGFPIVSRKWLICAHILNALFIVIFIALLLGAVGSFFNLSVEEARATRSLRGHYFGAFCVTGMLLQLKGKFITSIKNELRKNT